MQHAWRYGSVESAKCSTRETIKFFRQTGRRRGRRHGGFSGKQKEQRDLCRRGALLAGSDFTGDQLTPRQHKGPERDGDIGARTAQEPGCRLCEVRGNESQSRRGVGLRSCCPQLPFLLLEPRMEGREGAGAGWVGEEEPSPRIGRGLCWAWQRTFAAWPPVRGAGTALPTCGPLPSCPILMIPGNKEILTVSWGRGHVEFQGWELTSGPTLWVLRAMSILLSSSGERPRLPAGGALTTFLFAGMQPRDPCRPWRGTLASDNFSLCSFCAFLSNHHHHPHHTPSHCS